MELHGQTSRRPGQQRPKAKTAGEGVEVLRCQKNGVKCGVFAQDLWKKVSRSRSLKLVKVKALILKCFVFTKDFVFTKNHPFRSSVALRNP